MRPMETTSDDVDPLLTPDEHLRKARNDEATHVCENAGCGKSFAHAVMIRDHQRSQHPSHLTTMTRNNMLCRRCRHDRQKCDPQNRDWAAGEKCDRCLDRGFECSAPEKSPYKPRKRRSGLAVDDLPSNPHFLGDLSEKWPSLINEYELSENEGSLHGADLLSIDQKLHPVVAESLIGIEGLNKVSTKSPLHPFVETQDWSTLPSSRNSIYPTIAASAPSLDVQLPAWHQHMDKDDAFIAVDCGGGLTDVVTYRMNTGDQAFSHSRSSIVSNHDDSHIPVKPIPEFLPPLASVQSADGIGPSETSSQQSLQVSQFRHNVFRPVNVSPDSTADPSTYQAPLQKLDDAANSQTHKRGDHRHQEPLNMNLKDSRPGPQSQNNDLQQLIRLGSDEQGNFTRSVTDDASRVFNFREKEDDKQTRTPDSFGVIGTVYYSCMECDNAFESATGLFKHYTAEHPYQLSCNIPGCLTRSSFDTQNDVDRHRRDVHRVSSLLCGWEDSLKVMHSRSRIGDAGVNVDEGRDTTVKKDAFVRVRREERLRELEQEISDTLSNVKSSDAIDGSTSDKILRLARYRKVYRSEYCDESLQDVTSNEVIPDGVRQNGTKMDRTSSPGLFHTDPTSRNRCPYPDCGKAFKDLKTHMLTHASVRPEKCPIIGCEYNKKGFARQYDRDRHTLTHYRGSIICGFCVASERSESESTFNRVDVFKRHLTTIHEVKQIRQDQMRRGVAPGKCSMCQFHFENPQELYEHLDDCALRALILQFSGGPEALDAVEYTALERMRKSIEERHLFPEMRSDLNTPSNHEIRNKPLVEDVSQQSRRVYTTIRGCRINITSIPVDHKYLEALPEDMREEALISQYQARWEKARDTGDSTHFVDPGFLEALPEDIREDVERYVRAGEKPSNLENWTKMQTVQDSSLRAFPTTMQSSSSAETSLETSDEEAPITLPPLRGGNNSNQTTLYSITNESAIRQFNGDFPEQSTSNTVDNGLSAPVEVFEAVQKSPRVSSIPPHMSEADQLQDDSRSKGGQTHQGFAASKKLLVNQEHHEILNFAEPKQRDRVKRLQQPLQAPQQHHPTFDNEDPLLQNSTAEVAEFITREPSKTSDGSGEHPLDWPLKDEILLPEVGSLVIGSWQYNSSDHTNLHVSCLLERAALVYCFEDDDDRRGIIVPFTCIESISGEYSSANDTETVVIRLTESPTFIVNTYIGKARCTDFTENKQASQVLTHHLRGSSGLINRIHALVSLPQYKHRFQQQDSVTNTSSRAILGDNNPETIPLSPEHSELQVFKTPSRVKRHSKTLTGCLECKARSVKCGEERPICHNCSALDRKCLYMPPPLTECLTANPPPRDTLVIEPELHNPNDFLPYPAELQLQPIRPDFYFSGLTILSIGSWRRNIYDSKVLAISYSTETECMIYHMEYESNRYKIIYPFGYIRDIKWTESKSNMTKVIIELTEKPSLFVGGPYGDYKRDDFTENEQASKTLTHIWKGKSQDLVPQLQSLISLPNYQQRFQRFTSHRTIAIHSTRASTDLPTAASPPYELKGMEMWKTIFETFGKEGFPAPRNSSEYGGRTETLEMGNVPTDSGYASLVQDKLRVDTMDVGFTDESKLFAANYDDARTVYSDGASVETSQRDNFVERLAELLKQDLEDVNIGDLAPHEIFDDIKDCLADFAMRLGQETSSPKLRRAMAFIHRYRSLVGSSFKSLLLQHPSEEEDTRTVPADNMPLGELMSRWFKDELAEHPTTAPEDLCIPDDEPNLDESMLDENNPSELDDYSELITATESYRWLTSRLRNKILLTHRDSDACKAIRENVLTNIPREVVVRVGTASKVVQAVFAVDWPLQNFLDTELPPLPKSKRVVLGSIVSLTGSPPDIQAMTCNDYMHQTWPTTGLHLLHVVEESLNNDLLTAEMQRPDGACLAVAFENSSCIVLIGGSRDMVVELAEQLSWLSAALRSSLHTTDITANVPIISFKKTISSIEELPETLGTLQVSRETALSSERTRPILPRLNQLSTSRCEANSKTHIFEIDFHHPALDLHLQIGNCWQQVLPHCSIVGGFPIRRRDKDGLGMEIPLNIMAGLVGTKRVNQYRDTVFIRGFSAIYSPMQLVDDTIIWHLTCNKTGAHVCYRDVPGDVGYIKFENLEDKRHIVGWCTNIINRVGADSAAGPVIESQLPVTKPGCVLDDFLLTFPKEILYGPTFALLQCQKSIHLASATYRAKLKYLRDHFALLWDTEDDRGWLTNCLAAFLHLVKDTFLSYDAATRSELMALWERLRLISQSICANQPSEPTTHCFSWPCPDREYQISAEKDEPSVADVGRQIFTRVCDQLFDGLDKLITFQEQVEHDDLRRTSRSLRLLEGWSFPDLASEHGSKRARVMTLPTVAFSWAKLLRSLGTVTIFGERFGELLSPCKPESPTGTLTKSHDGVEAICHNLESSKFLVGVAMRDLCVKMRSFKHCPGALLVGDATILQSHASIFTQCVRQSGKDVCSEISHRSILMPWPVAHRKLLPSTLSRCQCDNKVNSNGFANTYVKGAVILGHDNEAGFYLDEAGNPVKGTPPDPAAEQEEAFNDSGFGTDSSRVSQDNIISRVTSRSTEEISIQDSGLSLKERGQSYNDSVVNGGAPVYGNVYVTNNNHMVAATQTSYLGTRSTPTPGHSHLSVPALVDWTPNAMDQAQSRMLTPGTESYVPYTGSKRSRSHDSESSTSAKRIRLPPPTGIQHYTGEQDGLRSSMSPHTGTASITTITSNQTDPIPSRLTTAEQVKRCCRCYTAMSVENPTAECEECIHEFCIDCGVLEDNSELAGGWTHV